MSGDDALKEVSEFRAVFQAAVDAILTIDGNGIIASLNPAAERIFGYAAQEVMGRNVSVLMPSPYREEHDGYLAKYIDTGDKQIIGIGREVKGRRKDGTEFPMYLSVAEVQVEEGRRFVGIVRDISEEAQLKEAREQLIEQLEQKNAELERFTYTVSHDLKSPLITIKGFLGGLEKDARAGNFERHNADIARIGKAADQMKLLLDDLLELSRVGRIVSPPEPISLSELAAQTIELLSGPIAERGAVVTVHDPLPTIEGDRTRLTEVLQNLIENALKFSRDGEPARIEIGASGHEEGRAVCFVRDEGVGIDPKYTNKVFGLFERLDHLQEGTGVGLALVKRIVEFHGGRVWVESVGLGRGSTFYFTLPLVGSSHGG
jgi:two-component system sensor kinase FixL